VTMSNLQQDWGDQAAGVNMLAVIVAIRRRWWIVMVAMVLTVLISIPVGNVVDGEKQEIHVAVELGQVPRRVLDHDRWRWELVPTIEGIEGLASGIEWSMASVLAEFNEKLAAHGEKPREDLKLKVSIAGTELVLITSEVPLQKVDEAAAILDGVARSFVSLVNPIAARDRARVDGEIERGQYKLDLLEADSRLLAEGAETLRRQRLAEANQERLKDDVLVAEARAGLEQAKAEAEATLQSHEAALEAGRVSRETLLKSQATLKDRIDQLDVLIAGAHETAGVLDQESRTAESPASADLLVLAMESLDDRHSRWIGERFQVLTELTIELPVKLATLDIRIATLQQEIAAQRVACSAAEQRLLAEPVVRGFDVREAELDASTAEVLGSGVAASIAIGNEVTRRQLQELVELRELSTPVSVVESGVVLGTVSRPVPIVIIWALAALVGILIGINVVVFSAILSSASERASVA